MSHAIIVPYWMYVIFTLGHYFNILEVPITEDLSLILDLGKVQMLISFPMYLYIDLFSGVSFLPLTLVVNLNSRVLVHVLRVLRAVSSALRVI